MNPDGPHHNVWMNGGIVRKSLSNCPDVMGHIRCPIDEVPRKDVRNGIDQNGRHGSRDEESCDNMAGNVSPIPGEGPAKRM